LRISDGAQLWTRPKLLRTYPSADPAIALITREVQPNGQYGGFAQLDPRTGQTTAQLPLAKAPKTGWWLAFPADLTRIGFLNGGRGGRDAAGALHGIHDAAGTTPGMYG